MLEELGVPYNVHCINIGKGDQFTPEFLAISPNNKIPAIVDPEGPGGKPISIFESGAILKYLGDQVRPVLSDRLRAQQVKVDEWLFWQVGGFGPMLGQNNHFSVYAPGEDPLRHQALQGRDASALPACSTSSSARCGRQGLRRRRLLDRRYRHLRLVERLRCATSIDTNEFPNFAAWRERMNARPAVATRAGHRASPRPAIDLATDKDAQKVLFNQR